MKLISDQIEKWLSNYLENSKLNGFVVGVSGGIDSAVVSSLCSRTLKSTILVNMPIHQESSQRSRGLSHMLNLQSKYSNVSTVDIDLTNLFDNFSNLFSGDLLTPLSLANSRARLRMTTLYQIAGAKNYLVVGTGNKVEDFGVGFFTKYGDGGVDISPIADLYKTEVRELGRYLGVSEEIINAAPTDGLWSDNRTDEDQLGVSYEELELCMKPNENPSDKAKAIYQKFNTKNNHKMIPIPICKINR